MSRDIKFYPASNNLVGWIYLSRQHPKEMFVMRSVGLFMKVSGVGGGGYLFIYYSFYLPRMGPKRS